jgi:DNA-binding response OmpR family regulator
MWRHRGRQRSGPAPGKVKTRSKLRGHVAPRNTVCVVAAPRILLVEDDDAIAAGLVRVLDAQGYVVDRLARGGPAGAAAGRDTGLVILDLGLPDVDGIEVCRRLRAANPELAILILSARDQELDVVAGLDAGADDYLIKPFRLSELLARVRAHMRRATPEPESEEQLPLTAGGVRLDPGARRAWNGEDELTLSPKEFDLLHLLVAHAGRVVTRDRIMREVWDTDWLGSTKTLDTHILTLRQKLGPDAIATLRGVGYRFETP